MDNINCYQYLSDDVISHELALIYLKNQNIKETSLPNFVSKYVKTQKEIQSLLVKEKLSN